MKKDQQTLLRMNFLIQAAALYQNTLPAYTSHFVYDFIQLSEKKLIRIDRALKRKIDTKKFNLRRLPAPAFSEQLPQQQQSGAMRE